MSDKYSERGVSAGKEDVHFAISKLSKGEYPNAFCKILPDLIQNDPEYCAIMHADGTGTKSSLAYIYWKETGDLSVWRNLVQDALVMNTDDMLCVGATDTFLFSNTIGRNKFLIPREVLAEMLQGMEDFFNMLSSFGITAQNTGGETADVGDLVRTIVLDATAYTRIKRSRVISNEKIGPDQLIIGLSSFGKTIYENTYNSGIGSNGLTNGRHDTLSGIYASKYPESYDPRVDPSLVYSGNYALEDSFEEAPLNVGQLLLSPTRTYLPFAKQLLDEHYDLVKGMIHCTGGGQTKCMKFVKDLHIIKDNLFPTPAVFRMIQSSSRVDWKQMYQVFNMGHRLEIFVAPDSADTVLKLAEQFGIEARIIGKTMKAEKNILTIQSQHGSFEFE